MLAAYNGRYWSMYVSNALDNCYLPHPQSLTICGQVGREKSLDNIERTLPTFSNTHRICMSRYYMCLWEIWLIYRKKAVSKNSKTFSTISDTMEETTKTMQQLHTSSFLLAQFTYLVANRLATRENVCFENSA